MRRPVDTGERRDETCRVSGRRAGLRVGAVCAQQSTDPTAADSAAHVGLAYMGSWYVIANIPYFGERGKLASRDEYRMAADGTIDTTYVYRKAFDQSEKTLASSARVVPAATARAGSCASSDCSMLTTGFSIWPRLFVGIDRATRTQARMGAFTEPANG